MRADTRVLLLEPQAPRLHRYGCRLVRRRRVRTCLRAVHGPWSRHCFVGPNRSRKPRSHGPLRMLIASAQSAVLHEVHWEYSPHWCWLPRDPRAEPSFLVLIWSDLCVRNCYHDEGLRPAQTNTQSRRIHCCLDRCPHVQHSTVCRNRHHSLRDLLDSKNFLGCSACRLLGCSVSGSHLSRKLHWCDNQPCRDRCSLVRSNWTRALRRIPTPNLSLFGKETRLSDLYRRGGSLERRGSIRNPCRYFLVCLQPEFRPRPHSGHRHSSFRELER